MWEKTCSKDPTSLSFWAPFPVKASSDPPSRISPSRPTSSSLPRGGLDPSSSVFAPTGTFGNSQSPASRPLSGLLISKKWPRPSEVTTRTQHLMVSILGGFFFTFSGKSVTLGPPSESAPHSSCLRSARHCALAGHSPHFGALGVQTVAPSSIRAWLKHPGLSASTTEFESLQWSFVFAGALGSPARALSLDRTLITLPSTTPALLPKAMEAIAEAVYIPIPGILCSSSTSPGILPPHLSRTCLAPSSKNLALL
mmetsp:Transcript_10450/g.31982  ORF Transcript_10450/g.31982 Transcript_10450/m.31982 type:complete len:254 (-) Transcript_10450:486-1247(-)